MDSIALRQSIPDSVLPYPKGAYNRSKYLFWKIITPFHNYWRDLLLSLSILKHEGRQHYTLGTLAPGKNVADLLKYLEGKGWGNHFIAWKDEDEVIGIRKLESFERQYHIRVFKNGEIRGHYEYSPECHPRWHLKEVGMEARHEEFLHELGDWIVPAASASTFFSIPASASVVPATVSALAEN
jgi:hypothetical protein